MVNIDSKKAYHLETKPVILQILFTDASGFGYNSFIVEKLNERIRWRNFIEKKQHLNSTARELLAANYSFGLFF